jgi:hypothetical protein
MTASASDKSSFLQSLSDKSDFIVSAIHGPHDGVIAMLAGDLSKSATDDLNRLIREADHVFVSQNTRNRVPPHFVINKSGSEASLALYVGHCDQSAGRPSKTTLDHDMELLSELMDVLGLQDILLPEPLLDLVEPNNSGSANRWTQGQLRHFSEHPQTT